MVSFRENRNCSMRGHRATNARMWAKYTREEIYEFAEKVTKTKRCCSCHRVLPVRSFTISRCWKSGLHPECRDCVSMNKKAYWINNRDRLMSERKKWYAAHRKERRELRRMKIHGISQAQYEEMLAEQGGKCAICKKVLSIKSAYSIHEPFPCVDHDHKTKKIRGLLCGFCNIGLGAFKDYPVRLESAIRYLRK